MRRVGRCLRSLEFTTLLKDLAPDVDAVVTTYNVKASAEDLKKLLKEAREAGQLGDGDGRECAGGGGGGECGG